MADEYTPTEKQVRNFWASDGTEQPAAKSYDRAEGLREFDRWLSAHDARVRAEAEAERDEEADSNRWLRSNVFTLENERDALARRIEAVRETLAATRPQYSPLGVECPETAHGLHARVAAALDGEDGA